MTVFWIVVLLVLAGMAYVRLSPLDVETWHTPELPAMAPGEYPGAGRFVGQYVQDGDGQAAFERLHQTALATPRTQVLAGSPGEGKVTYVTRSRGMGFPDMTTVTLTQTPANGQSMIQIFGRLRFGKYDMGVNKARIRDWVARAKLAEGGS